MEHCNPAERKAWNKFKLEFRKSQPNLKHDAKYYQRLRLHYNERDCKTLDEWLVVTVPMKVPAYALLH